MKVDYGAAIYSKLNKQIEQLKTENEKLKAKLELAMSQNYCTMCGNTLDGYVPPKKKLEGLE